MLTALPRRARGVTLIELMIGLAIMAVVLGLGMPSFSAWLQNLQIRGTAEAIHDGLSLARNEAVRRNANVRFVLGADNGWSVCVEPADRGAGCPVPADMVQSRAGAEGTRTTLSVVVTPSGADTVTFNGFGRVAANSDGGASITQVDVDSASLDAALSRQMREVVGVGGSLRLCDPQVASGDVRACL